MPASKPEDVDLSPDQFVERNRRFYDSGSSPYGYVRQRVRALIVAGSRDEHVLDAQRGVRLGRHFVAGFPEDDPLLDPDSMNSYVMTESVVLFHHAAEALVRLVLAHIDAPDCPWLEMRRLTFGRYKAKLDGLAESLDAPETRAALMAVFYGAQDSSETGYSPQQWEDLTVAVVEFIGLSIANLRSGSELYNAAKHGLAIAGGEDRFMLLEGAEEQGQGALPDAERLMLSAKGHCLTYLHRGEEPPPRWMMTVTWANPAENIALATLASRFIENLWLVARASYLKGPQEQPSSAIEPADLTNILRILYRKGTANLQVSTFLRYEGDQGLRGSVSFTYPGTDARGPGEAARLW